VSSSQLMGMPDQYLPVFHKGHATDMTLGEKMRRYLVDLES